MTKDRLTQSTSTPQSSVKELFIASLSSIGSPNSTHDYAEDSSNLSVISDTSGIPTDANQSHNDYYAFFNSKKKFKYHGNIWKVYKPKNDGLYSDISRDPHNVENLAKLLLRESPKNAVWKLLQLFADISGFQSFSIKDAYIFEEPNANHVVNQMETKLDLHFHTNNKYLFQEKGNMVDVLKNAVFYFLEQLIYAGDGMDILFNPLFEKHVFVFVRAMSKAEKIRAIRHTGAVLAAKILTPLTTVYNAKYLDEITVNEAKKKKLEGYMNQFYIIFFKNCKLYDDKCVNVRLDYALEIRTWFLNCPQFFLKLGCHNCLTSLMLDQSKQVRLAVLDSLLQVIETGDKGDSEKILRNDSVVETVCGRFEDVSTTVAGKALDVFYVILKRFGHLFLTTGRVNSILKSIYSSHYSEANKAAKCLVDILRRDNSTSERFVRKLTNFAARNPAQICLFVEACLEECPELKDWKLYLNIFFVDKIAENKNSTLLTVMFESLHITIEGQTSLLRVFPKPANVNSRDHSRVAEVLLPQMVNLFQKFSGNTESWLKLLKIVTFVKYEGFLGVNGKHYKNILAYLVETFEVIDDSKLIVSIVETFHYFYSYEGSSCIKDWAISKIDALCVTTIDTFLTLNFTDQSEFELVISSRKLAVICQHFKWIKLKKQVKWDHLLKSMTQIGYIEEINKNILICCQWYLVWTLRNLIEISDDSQIEPQNQLKNQMNCEVLYKNLTEFITLCYHIIGTMSKVGPIHFTTFNCLCELLRIFTQSVKEPTKKYKYFHSLFKIDSEEHKKILVDFVGKHVIENKEMPLSDRQSYLLRIEELVYLSILPPQYLANIYRFYQSHNTEFGELMEHSMNEMQKQKGLNMVVLYTFTIIYEEIYTNFHPIDMNRRDCKELKYLIKQFMISKFYKNNKKEVQSLTILAIAYSVKTEENAEFLDFTQYFFKDFDADLKLAIYNYFLKRVPNKKRKMDVFLRFKASLLNKGNGNKKRVKPIRCNTPVNIEVDDSQ